MAAHGEIICAPDDLLCRGTSSISFRSGAWASSRFRAQKLREPADRAEIAMRCHGAGLRCSCEFHSLHVIRAQSEGIRRPEMRRFPDRARKRLPDSGCTEGGKRSVTLDVIAMGFLSAERFRRAQRARELAAALITIGPRNPREYLRDEPARASNSFKLKLEFSPKRAWMRKNCAIERMSVAAVCVRVWQNVSTNKKEKRKIRQAGLHAQIAGATRASLRDRDNFDGAPR